MREHHLSVSRTARYVTLGEPGPAVRETWFVLHGYGELAGAFLRQFESLDRSARLFVAPEGLSRFYLGRVAEPPAADRPVGASWMTREDRLAEIDDYVRYLDAVCAQVSPAKKSVTALGFSQGTATVCRWAALGSSRIDRLILWGGEVPPDLDLKRLRVPKLTLVYGTRDEFFTTKVVAANEARLRDQGVPYELISFEGGHAIDEETLRRL